MSNIQLLRETASVAVLAQSAINAVVEGEIDPIVAHINICKMEAAIKAFKDNEQVRDITLRELAKYGKKQSFGDCTLEEAEVGVRYDYSRCNDALLNELNETKKLIEADIKEREKMLKALPLSGMADPNTGELMYPPARFSKTTIKTTFKKH